MEKKETKEKLKFMVRSTILDRRRLLVIDSEYIEFDDQDRLSEAPTRFVKTDIDSLRYGVKAIRGYRLLYRYSRYVGQGLKDPAQVLVSGPTKVA
jgi:hypothetical protein